MSQERRRCFVAIRVPEAIQDLLDSVQNEIRERVGGGVWTRRGNLHLTLKFLGDLEPYQIRVGKDELNRIAGRHPPFSMWFGGIGVFPRLECPRVLWIGVTTGAIEVAAIAQEINVVLSNFGFPTDEQPFCPHITLARFKKRTSLSALTDIFQQYNRIDGAAMVVNDVGILHSRPQPSGSLHTPLEICPLQNR